MTAAPRWLLAPAIAGVLSVAWATPVVQAATISLTPLLQEVALGEQVSLTVEMDFSDDATIGGGFDTFFDPNFVRFVSFTFDNALGDDPAFRTNPQGLTNEVSEIGFGNFNGISGPTVVGTMVFDTIATGSTAFTMADNDTRLGPFFSADTSLQQVVTYTGADLTIAAVPLPPGLLLLMSGIIGVSVIRRRN